MAAETENRRSLFYSRRRGHKLRPLRQALMQELLPKLAIELATGDGLIDPVEFFPDAKKNTSGSRSVSAPASIWRGRPRVTQILALSAANPI